MAERTRVLVVGRVLGNEAFIKAIMEYPGVVLLGVSCPGEDDAGDVRAREMGISFSKDYKDFISEADLIFDLYRDPALREEIEKNKPTGAEISGRGCASIISYFSEKEACRDTGTAEESERFRLLAEATTEGVVVHEEGIVVDANQKILDQLGYAREEVLGKNILDFISEDTRGAVRSSIEQNGNITYSAKGVRKDGTDYPIEITARTCAVEDMFFRVAVVRDLSKKERLSSRIMTLNETLVGLGEDHKKNIESILSTCGEISGADMLAYNSLNKGMFVPAGQWGSRDEKTLGDMLEARFFYDIISKGSADGSPVYVRELEKSGQDDRYRRLVSAGIVSYIGYPICHCGNCLGVLCLLFREKTKVTEEDLRLLGILADALGREEERKEAIDDVTVKEKELRTFFENAADAILWSDPETGRILRCNKAAEVLLANDRDQIEGMNQFEIYPSTGGIYRDNFGERYGDPGGEDAEIRTGDGDIKYVRISASMVDIGGRQFLQAILRDVTDRRKVEDELARSEAEYRQLVEGANYPIIKIRANGDILFLNSYAAKLIGRSPGDLVGKNVWDLFPREKIEDQMRLVRSALSEDEKKLGLLQIDGLKGNEIWFETSIQPLDEETGEHDSVLLIAIDITHAKEAEETLRKSREIYTFIAENTGDLIGITDLDGNYLYASPSHSRLGRAATELEGTSLYGIMHRDDRKQARKQISSYIERFLASEKDHVMVPDIEEHMEFRISGPGNSELSVEATFNVVRDPVTGDHTLLFVAKDISQRKVFEEELRRNEALFRLIAENASDLISLMKLDGTYTYLSPSYTRFGYEPQQLVGRKGYDLIHPDDRDRIVPVFRKYSVMKFARALRLTFAGKAHKTIEYRFKAGDGRWVHMEATANMVKSRSGKGFEAILISRDITERKNAELAIQENEEKYRNVVERAGDGICILQAGSIRYSNPAMTGFLGKNEKELLGEKLSDLVVPEDKGKVEDLENKMISGKEKQAKTEIRFPGGDGKEILVEADSSVTVYLGHPAILVFLRDITESHKARSALMESEERFRTLFETAEDPIFLKDTRGRYTHVNDEAVRLLGCEKEDIIGHTDQDILGAKEGKKEREIDAVVLSGETVKDVRSWIVGGVHQTYDVVKVPLRDSDGNIYGLCGIARDITDRSNLEESLKTSRDYLDRIINSIADPIFVKDRDHRWVLLNDAYCKFMGYPREELLGRSDFDYFPKEEAEVFWAKDELVFGTGRENINEEAFTDSAGRTHTILTKKTLYLDARGESLLVGVIRDITERKEMEKRLQQQQEIMSNIMRTIPHSVFWKDKRSVYMGCSDSFALSAGLASSEDIVGKTDFDLAWQTEEAEWIRKCDKQVIKTGEPLINVEESITVSGGRKATLLASMVPLKAADGSITGVLGIYADVTDMKNTEEMLRESEAMYRTIFENTGSAMMIMEKDMTISMVNGEFVKLSGLDREEAEGKKNLLDIVHSGDREKVMEYHRIRTIDPSAPPRSYGIKVLDSGGTPLEAYITVAMISGTSRCVVSIMDISELKENEAKLKKQKELLDNTNKALEHKLQELETATTHIKKLEGLVPICAACKKMRLPKSDPKNPDSWVRMEQYITDRTDASFTHGLCPDCIRKMYGETRKEE